MATIYAGVIAAALGSAFTVAAIVAAWMATHPRPKAPQAWLLDQGLDSALREALRPALAALWQEGWVAGASAAGQLSGIHTGATFQANDFMERWGRQWLNEIVQTRLTGLARILADSTDDEGGLIRRVQAYLADEDQAHLIAVTEVTRAVNIAATETYRMGNIFEVRWKTEDANACPQCLANEAAGSRQLGVPFPSGATAPPQHPRCRCALMPA